MKFKYRKVLVVGLGIGMTALVAVPNAYASRPDTLPAGTTVTAALKTGTNMTFKGTIDGTPIVVTCKSFSGTGKVPAGKPYSMNLAVPPKITGCMDDLGGTDTIKTNQTNGKWTLSVNKVSPYKLTLSMPKAGATFTTNLLTSCVITAAPTARNPIKGSYDGTSTDTVTAAPIPVSATGCTAKSPTTTSATVVFTPAPGPPPF